MCGIGGIVSFGDARCLTPDLKAMSQAMAHRGPDDEGFAVIDRRDSLALYSGPDSTAEIKANRSSIDSSYDSESKIGLCHRRFAILDPTPAGHQPWFDPIARTVLVFNGEIYNYVELRQELSDAGYGPFKTQSDTEVVSVAYRAWGGDCFKRFNGFWSLAILCMDEQRLVLCRDRFGKKPLYLRELDGTLVFASEIRALMAGASPGNDAIGIDHDAAALYLLYDRRDTLRDSLWKGVHQLAAASLLTIELKSGHRSEVRFWQLPDIRESPVDLSLDRAAEQFRELLFESVRGRLRADVPVAANLSGGMDSSAIVAAAKQVLGGAQQLETNTIYYLDAPELDERPFAKSVADHVQTNHTELGVSSEDAWTHMDELIEAFEEPVHSAAFMSQWLGWRSIRDQGIKVILHGAAADEILAGYQYHPDIDDYHSFNTGDFRRYFSARPIWQLRDQARTLKWFGKGRVWPAISNPLRTLLRLPDRRFFNRDYEPEAFRRWYSGDLLRSAEGALNEFNSKFVESDRDLESRLFADVNWLRVPFWLNAMDKSMMQIPVEVRMPFLDYRLVEFMFRLPISYIYRNGWTKFIMRQAMQDYLPKSIAWRRTKMGFTVPKASWLNRHSQWVATSLDSARSTLREFVNVDVMLRDVSSVPSDVLWRSVNFAKWVSIFHGRS